MYYAMGVSVPSLHRESTDSLIMCKAEHTTIVKNTRPESVAIHT